MNVGNLALKGIGLTAIGMVAYDAHKIGKLESSAYEEVHKSHSIEQAFYRTMRNDSQSSIQNSVKKKYFNFITDENLSGVWSGIKGYFKGLGNVMVNGIVPLTLAVGTLLTTGKVFDKKSTSTPAPNIAKTAWQSTKKVISKFCGIGLVAYAGLFLIRDVMGFGKPKY